MFILAFANACSTATEKQATVPEATIEKRNSNHFSVQPGPKTQITTYHVQTEKFPLELKQEAEQSIDKLAGKCWVYSETSNGETTTSGDPEYCIKFVAFTNVAKLKPYKRVATDIKMLLTQESADQIRVQNFSWNGAKLQRVRNSGSKLPDKEKSDDRFANFLVVWAIK